MDQFNWVSPKITVMNLCHHRKDAKWQKKYSSSTKLWDNLGLWLKVFRFTVREFQPLNIGLASLTETLWWIFIAALKNVTINNFYFITHRINEKCAKINNFNQKGNFPKFAKIEPVFLKASNLEDCNWVFYFPWTMSKTILPSFGT